METIADVLIMQRGTIFTVSTVPAEERQGRGA